MPKQFLLFAGFIFMLNSCQSDQAMEIVGDNKDLLEINAPHQDHLVNDYPPLNADGSLNVLVEVPAGTIEKSEVNKKTGALEIELIDGEPRKVNYLPYPGNYGMIPQTLLPKEQGGDGDPLDVIILGETLEKGKFYSCKLIGVLNLLDRGEQDDKLIAVLAEGPFSHLNSMVQLDDEFEGVSLIIETWFKNYKGKEMMESQGFAEKRVADSILTISIDAFKKK